MIKKITEYWNEASTLQKICFILMGLILLLVMFNILKPGFAFTIELVCFVIVVWIEDKKKRD